MEGPTIKIFSSDEDFLNFLQHLENETFTRYISVKARNLGQKDVQSLDGRRIYFHDVKSEGPTIEYDGVPFVILGYQEFACHQGKERSKHNKTQTSDHDHDYGSVKRCLLQRSKKIGCQASIKLRKIVKFPEFKVDSAKDTKFARLAISTKLKAQFSANTKQDYQILAFFDVSNHNHGLTEISASNQQIDKRLAEKIKDLVHEGYTKVSDKMVPLNAYAETLNDTPNTFNRRFNPNRKEVYSIMYREIVSGRFSENDQINVKHLCDKYREDHPNDMLFFRPASCLGETVEGLMFVHQTPFQKELLNRYGSDMILLDATYQTSRYDLATFFMCVLSNSGYQVVATFVLDKESTASITEALKVIKHWNPNWNPAFAMVDFDTRLISALERTFSGITVYLCYFHAIQAWQRWLGNKKNGMASMKEDILQKLKGLANSKTTDDYHKQEQAFRHSDAFQSLKFKNWMEKKWLCNHHRWVKAFRTDATTVQVNTTNGVERIHLEFKKNFLNKYGEGKTLESELRVLLTKFLPSLQKRYQEQNHYAQNSTRCYTEGIPAYLIDRPKTFVKHMLDRMPPKVSEIPGGDFHFIDNSDIPSFTVKGGSTDLYSVTFTHMKPACTCHDWIKHNLPCKHIIAVMNTFPDFSWDKWNSDYTTQPCMTLHEFVENKTCMTVTDETSVEEELPEINQSPDLDRSRCIEVLKNISNSIYCVRNDVLKTVLNDLREVEKVVNSNMERIDNLPVKHARKGKKSSAGQRRVSGSQKDKGYQEPQGNVKMIQEMWSDVLGKEYITTRDEVKSETSTVLRPGLLPHDFKPQDHQDECKVVEMIWQGGQMDIKWVGPYIITAGSIQCISDRLSDEVIDSFLYCLSAKMNVLHVNCLTMTAIFEGNVDLHHCMSAEPFLLNHNTIVGAYNEGGGHWVLIIIHPKDRKIVYVNSLGALTSPTQDVVLKWYKFLKCRFDAGLESELPQTWKIHTPQHARQLDSTSCGIYTLKFAENYLEGRSLTFNWSVLDVDSARLSLAVYLLSVAKPSRIVDDSEGVEVVESAAMFTAEQKQPHGAEGSNVNSSSVTFTEPSRIVDDSEDVEVVESAAMFTAEQKQHYGAEGSNVNSSSVTITEPSRIVDDSEDVEVVESAAMFTAEPEQHFSVDSMPEQHPSVESMPEQHPSVESMPEQHPSVESMPEQHPSVESMPGQHPSVESMPEQHPSVESMLEQHPSVESMPEQYTYAECTALEESGKRGTAGDHQSWKNRLRSPKQKRKRYSFFYEDYRKRAKKFCICQKPNDGRLYWQCEGCSEWWHPSCLGLLETEEPEHFFCETCKQKQPHGEEESIVKKVNTHDISSSWESITRFLASVAKCTDVECSEQDHRRHHSFINNTKAFIMEQKQLYGFGCGLFEEEAIDWLHDTMITLIKYDLHPTRSATSARIPTCFNIPKKSKLYQLFSNYNVIHSYLEFVLFKEALLHHLVVVKMMPYEHAEDIC